MKNKLFIICIALLVLIICLSFFKIKFDRYSASFPGTYPVHNSAISLQVSSRNPFRPLFSLTESRMAMQGVNGYSFVCNKTVYAILGSNPHTIYMGLGESNISEKDCFSNVERIK